MLRNGDNVTSAGVGHFQSLEDLVIINKFSAPVVRPTGAPTISPTEGSTEFPTKRPVLFPSQRPSASDPSKGLTNNPNKTTSPILVDSVSLVDSDAYADPSLAKGDSLNQIGSVTNDDKAIIQLVPQPSQPPLELGSVALLWDFYPCIGTELRRPTSQKAAINFQ